MLNKLAACTAVLLLSLTSVASQNNPDKESVCKTTPKKSNILLLGDSLAQGMASEFYKQAKSSNYTPVVLAKSGSQSAQWSTKIEKIMCDIRPKITIVSLGTNDSGPKDVEFLRVHVKRIRESAQRYGSKIFWILPRQLPPRFKGQDGIRTIITEELKETYDSKALVIEMSNDRIHPTAQGYRRWFQDVWKNLANKEMICL